MAVGIAALNGPATIAARLAEIALAGRLASITTATIAAAHIPLAFVLLLVLAALIAVVGLALTLRQAQRTHV